MELQKSLPDFERHHIVPFAISYDAVDVLATFATKQHITYTLLSDEGSTIIRALGLFNEQEYLDLIPAHRLGDPEEVGKLCSYLASDDAGYITGACITIDGGLTSIPAG